MHKSDLELQIEKLIKKWVQDYVVQQNLCPFAGRTLNTESIRFKSYSHSDTEAILEAIAYELQLLLATEEIETSVIILSNAAEEFDEYLEVLELANQLLVALNFEGIFQLASFHPHYVFANTPPDAPENFTNRSPFPLIHLLREASVESAVTSFPNTNSIPERNIALMNRQGTQQLQAKLAKFKLQ